MNLIRSRSNQNQVKREIKYTLASVPWISIPTVALFFLEVRGYSKLYDRVDDSPIGKQIIDRSVASVMNVM